ncbi:MAG: hypothetical protein OEY38_18370 [Gammaproteobacteria bacterium]|nr:hypothetical protein [Gammaproteobacteria bacterium]
MNILGIPFEIPQSKDSIFALVLDREVIDFFPLSRQSYSWRKDEPLVKLRKIVNSIKRTLAYLSCLQVLKWSDDGNSTDRNNDAVNNALRYAKNLLLGQTKPGRFGQVFPYQPRIPNRDTRTKESSPCFVCSK